MNAEHAGIALTDIGDAIERLLGDGVSEAEIVTALIIHTAGICKFGDLCPHAAKSAFASIISDPTYRATRKNGHAG